MKHASRIGATVRARPHAGFARSIGKKSKPNTPSRRRQYRRGGVRIESPILRGTEPTTENAFVFLLRNRKNISGRRPERSGRTTRNGPQRSAVKQMRGAKPIRTVITREIESTALEIPKRSRSGVGRQRAANCIGSGTRPIQQGGGLRKSDITKKTQRKQRRMLRPAERGGPMLLAGGRKMT